MRIFTIGFTKTTAEKFFARLQKAGVKRMVDVRLNNISQLAGFAKRDDLRYFLETICSIDYAHRPELAPTQDMLDAYSCGLAAPDTRSVQSCHDAARHDASERVTRSFLGQ